MTTDAEPRSEIVFEPDTEWWPCPILAALGDADRPTPGPAPETVTEHGGSANDEAPDRLAAIRRSIDAATAPRPVRHEVRPAVAGPCEDA